jgi:two-component system, chemotaxis family, protein-glutamate methylesterase/glutaminase
MQQQRLLQQGDKVRVLVVDDSVVLRRALTAALESDPAIEVVGVAASGELALQKVDQLNPDVVTLDVEMPGLNGLETLTQLKRQRPWLRVIMVSTLTARGAETTMDALSRGADDYVAKANTSSLEESVAQMSAQLCPRVKQFFRLGASGLRPPLPASGAASSSATLQPRPSSRPSEETLGRGQTAVDPKRSPVPSASLGGNRRSQLAAEVLVVGISTGGPQALAEFLPALGSNFHLPVLIVQHMPVMFTRLLAQRLDQQCPQWVREAEEGMLISPDTITLAPGDFHMQLRRGKSGLYVTLNQGPPENCCRPAADVLFRSAAEVCGGAVAGLVMTGMGQDGFAGARSLKAAGGLILAQDEASSVVWGMPGEVVKGGLADKVLALAEIAPEVRRLGSRTDFASGPANALRSAGREEVIRR